MASGDLGAVLGDLEVLFLEGTAAGLTDVELLDRFLVHGGAGGEAAFTALVRRHGPMVLRVCRGELNDRHGAEDAFQATFLILARQARSIRDGACLASWLYGVARRVARRARLDRARRVARERRRAIMVEDDRRLAPEPPELLPEIQEELDRLPERYRSAIVLCYLEGRTHEEAARQLRIPVGTVKIRLSRGRERLRGRLVRRGLAPGLVVAALSVSGRAAVPADLLDVTVKAATAVAACRAAGVSATVAALVHGVLRAMLIHKLKTLAALAAASTMLIVTSLVMVSVFSKPVRSAQPPQPPSVRPPAAKRDPAPRPRARPPEEVVVVAVMKSRYQRSSSQPGTVEAFEKVDVLPTASGVLGRLTVDLGSAVKRGDVLAEVEALELGLDVERSEAAVRQARARLRTGDARVKVAESAIRSAVADVEAARAQSQAAVGQRSYREKQYRRIQELVKQGSVEHRLEDEELGRVETARSAEAAAGAQLVVVQANVANAEARLVAAMAERDETKEGLQLAEIDMQKARLAVDACRIRAPLDGYVVARRGHVGEFVRSAAGGGSTPIVTIAQTRVVRIVAGVPDRDVPFVEIGDPAVFTPDALGTLFKGKVSRLAEAEDPHDRTMRVEIDLQNADGRLRPGMYGRVAIELAKGPEALSIPSAAVGRGTGAAAEFYCYRVVNGHTVLTPIWVAHEDSERAWITRGLNEGDLVVADAAKLREGEEVKPARDGGRPGAGGQR